MGEGVTLDFTLNIINESLNIKIKKIKMDTWLEIRIQLETNLDSYCTLTLESNRMCLYIFIVLYRHIII